MNMKSSVRWGLLAGLPLAALLMFAFFVLPAFAAPALTTMWSPPSTQYNTTNNYVFFNITSSENLNQSLLEWINASGYTNISMSNTSSTDWYVNMTSLTEYTYKYALWLQNTTGTWSREPGTGVWYASVDWTPPTWSNNGTNASALTKNSDSVNFNVTLIDSVMGEGDYIFSYDNGTGSFVNDTPATWMNETPINVIKTITGTYGQTVRWYWWFNDTLDNSNQTDTWSFTVANTAPIHTNPILNSTSGTNLTTENLTCWNQSTSDPDGDPVKNIYNWQEDGTSITALNMPFEGGSNSTWTKDYSGFGNNGSVTSATWSSTGGYDSFGAYQFDGSNDYINVGNDTSLQSQAFTVMAWIYHFNKTNSRQAVLGNSNFTDNFKGGYLMRFWDSNATLEFRLGSLSNGTSITTAVTPEAWTHVAMSFNGTAFSAYKNGDLVESKTTTYAISAKDIWIGRDQSNSNEVYFNGTIDEVRIYNRSLSTEQVQALYQNNTNLLVSQETHRGDNWTCSVTPNDRADDGATSTSDWLAVEFCGTLTQNTTLIHDGESNGTCFTIGADDIVLDCQDHTITGNETGYGISLTSRTNVTVQNCNISNFTEGIHLSTNSNNNTLTNNTANTNTNYGIYLTSSSSNTLTNNTAKHNSRGIHLDSNINNTLTSNTANNNTQFGIYIWVSSNNTLISNTANNNTQHGIYLSSGSSNNLTSNTANNNEYGIRLFTSSFNNLTNNTAFYNTESGVHATASSNSNTLVSNTLTANDDGIYVESTVGNNLTFNTANNNSRFGMYVGYSNSTTVNNNTAKHNSNSGIQVQSVSHFNTVTFNTFFNNTNGIRFFDSAVNNTITNNTVINSSYIGIRIEIGPHHNTFASNSVTNSTSAGISLYQSHNNTLINNTVTDSNESAVSISSSSSNTLTNNTFASSVEHGVAASNANSTVLTFNNLSSNAQHGAVVTSSTGCILTDNTVNSNAQNGIYLNFSSDSNLTNNTVSYNALYGVAMESSHNSNLTSNTVSYNTQHAFRITSSNYTNLTSNTLINNSHGIYLFGSNASTLTSNTALNNTYGIRFASSHFNTLTSNTLVNSTVHGIWFQAACDNNTLTSNTVNDSVQYGIILSTSHNNTLTSNTANNNTLDGIYLYSSSDSTLTSNILTSNANHGIYLLNSNSSNLDNNTATNNTQYGVHLNLSANTTLTNNTLAGNGNNLGVDGYLGTQDIGTGNTVGGKPTYYIKDTSDTVYNASTNAGTLYCINCSNITVENLSIAEDGLNLVNTSSVTLLDQAGKTQNYSLDNVTGLKVKDTDEAELVFLQPVTEAGTNMSADVVLGSNSVFVNSSAQSGLNVSANITLYSITEDPAELRPAVDEEDDGTFEVCYPPQCNNLSYVGTTYVYNVSHFTTYSSGAPPSLTVTYPPNGTIVFGNASINGSCSDSSGLSSVFTNSSVFSNQSLSGTSDNFSLTNISGMSDQEYHVLVSCNDSMNLVTSVHVYFTYSSAAGQVNGHITNAEGTQALEGVSVSAHNASGFVYSDLTGSDGYYWLNLQPGDYNLTLAKTGYITKNVSVTIASYTTVNASLYEVAHGGYNVTVVDARNGRPIPNATVNVSWASSSRARTTDANGVVLIEVPANNSVYYPDGVYHSFRVTSDGYIANDTITGMSINNGTTYNLTIAQEGSCSLAGYVVDAKRWGDAGIAGAFIEVWDFNNTAKLNWSSIYFYNTTADSNGAYTMNFPSTIIPGCNPKLHVNSTGYYSDSNVIVTGSGQKNISLTGSAWAAGYVVDYNNQTHRVSGATVKVYDQNIEIIYRVDTDSNGVFNISVKDGEQRNITTVSKTGYYTWTNTTVYTSSVYYGQIILNGSGNFSGTVADWQNDSIKLAGANVSIVPTSPGESYNTTTDANGYFTLLVSGDETYNLVFQIAGYDDNTTLTDQAPAPLGTVTLRGKNHITGTITDPLNMLDTRPDNVTVKVNSSANTNSYSVTGNSAGQYSVYIPSTMYPYNVIFQKSGYDTKVVASSVPGSPTIDAELVGATHVEGYVRDKQNNNPIEGAYIEFFNISDNVTHYNTSSDSSGHYSINLGIWDFNYGVKATKAGYTTFKNGTAHTPGVDLAAENINMEGARSVWIKVIDAHDATPIDNVVVCIDTQTDTCVYDATTNVNGNASLNIAAVPYRIRINRDGYLEKQLPDSGYYDADFNQTVNLTARAGIYVYDANAASQAAIPQATVVVYDFHNNTNFSYDLNETVVNVTVTCNASQLNSITVSANGITYNKNVSGTTSAGETNVTLRRVPAGQVNLTLNASALGCSLYSTIIDIPTGGQAYNFSYDLNVTRLQVKTVDPRGELAPDVNVTYAANASINCTTGSSGACTLYYIPDYPENVTANSTLYYPANKTYNITAGELNNVTSDPISLKPRPGNLSVLVLNATALGVPDNVNVSITNGTYNASNLTSNSGWANFTIPTWPNVTGFQNITVNGTAQGYNWTNITNAYVVPVNTTAVTVTLEENSLLVHVSGSDVEGANVSLTNPSTLVIQNNGWGNPLSNLTDENGNTLIRAVPVGTYNLTVNKSGFVFHNETYTMGIGNRSINISVNDTEAPQWDSGTQEQIPAGDSVNESTIVTVRVRWRDNTGLGYAWLSTNKTGSWANESPTSLSGILQFSTFTINTTGYGNKSIHWKIYANDTGGRQNVTPEMNFSINDTLGPVITFVSPTPENGAYVSTKNWVYINVTFNEKPNATPILNWNGQNDTDVTWVSNSDTNWYVNKTGLPNDDYNFTIYANDSFANNGSSVTRTITLDAHGNLTVEVSDIASNPLEGINVSVTNDTIVYSGSQLTNSEGKVRLTNLTAVTYQIITNGSDLGYAVNTSFLDLGYGENTIRVKLNKTILTVNVTDTFGDAIQGASVKLWNDSTGTGEEPIVQGLTNASGLIEFAPPTYVVPPCTQCNVTVSKPDPYSPSTNSSLVDITAGAFTQLDIDPQAPFFPEKYSLNFTINDNDANADGIMVEVRYNDTGALATNNTTTDGHCMIHNITSDIYNFVINGSIAGWSDYTIYGVSVGKTIMNNGTTDLNGLVTMTVAGNDTYYIKVMVGGYHNYDDMDNQTNRTGSYDPAINGSISISMTGATNLTGNVSDENFLPISPPQGLGYEPIANATVSVYTASDCGSLQSGSLRYQFETPKNGSYSIPISPRQRSDPDSNQSFCVKASGIGFTTETFGPLHDLGVNTSVAQNLGLSGNSTVSGWVKDVTTGNGIPNANVLLKSAECYNVTGPSFPTDCNAYSVSADASGFFTAQVNPRIDPANYSPDYQPYTLRASAISYNQSTYTLSSVPSENGVYYLAPAGLAWVKVNVTSSSGQNLTSSVLITVDGQVKNLSTSNCYQNDNMLTCGIDAGSPTLVANGSAAGYGVNTTVFSIVVDEVKSFDIVLTETRANITLISDEGEGLPNVTVALEGTSFQNLTDENGTVLFSLVPTGTYNVSFSGGNVSEIYFWNASAGNEATLTVTSPGQVNNITLVLNETRALFNITNESAGGIAGLQLNLYNNRTGQTHQATTNATGQALATKLPYGNYTVSFNETQLYSLGYIPRTGTAEVLPGEDQATNNSFSINLTDVKVIFNVTNTTGDPVTNANITMYLDGVLANNSYNQSLTGLTDTLGLLKLNNTIPTDYANGSYTFDLDANASGYGIYTNNSLYVNLTGVEVQAEVDNISITIIVRNQTSPLLEGVNITLYYLGGGVAQNALGQTLSTTGVTDNVTFTHLFTNNYTLEMRSSMYFSQNATLYFNQTWSPALTYHSSPITYEASGTSNTSTFIFSERSLTVYVNTTTSSTLAYGVNISIVNATDTVNSSTGVTGSYTFTSVPDGTYNVSIDSDYYFSQNWTFNTSDLPGLGNEKRFTMYERSLTINVRDSAGSTLAYGVNVSLVNATGDTINSSTGVTDTTSFTSIPDGTHTVNVTSNYYFNQNRTFITTNLSNMANVMNFTMYERNLTVQVRDRNGSVISRNVTVGLYNTTGVAQNTTGADLLQNTTDGSVTFSGLMDGEYNLSVSAENYTTLNTSIDTNNYISPVYVYLLKPGYGYFNVSTSPSSCSVELRDGSGGSAIASGSSNGFIVLEVNASVYNESIYVHASKTNYYSNETGPYTITAGEIKNVSISLSSVPAPPAAPGGVGGGGGVAPTPPCQEDWTCTSWGSCVDGTQTRVCTDQNSCGTAINKSDESRSCVIAMTLDLPATYVNADQCVTQSLTIKNTGTADIRNLAAPSDVTITDCCTITSTQRISKLGAGRRETISIRVCAPKDAVKDSYSTTLEITSNEINKSVTAHIHVTKEYAEVLADRADQLGSDLAQIDPAQLDITQAGWYAEAQRAVEKAKEYAAEGNFNAAEAALQLASANLAKIAAYVLPPLDIWWLLPVLPIVIVAGGLGVWWSRRRPPKYAYKPVRGYPIRYDKSALLKEVEGLHKKVQGIKRDKLGLTDKYYYDKAKGALDSVKQHILGDNLVAAKRTLTEAETYLRVLESRLLSFNLLKTVKG